MTILASGQTEQMASVAWMPLHMHPYYEDTYGYSPGDFPAAAGVWPGIVCLPIYPLMTNEDLAQVVEAVRDTAREVAS